jgi:hypothetical protein
MRIAQIIQTAIHKLEVGAGARYLRFAALALLAVTLVIWYNLHAWRNFSAPEAMDSAQLARNISEGKGYTTQFIRPLSLYLVQAHAQGKGASTNADFDFARIKTMHPDLANAPVYPLALAGLMKILPFHYGVELKKSFWSDNGRFARYQPDFLISLFGEILLFIAAVLTFFLARKLFDESVAWLSAGLVIGCELLWRFSTSGLSTMLLLVIFLALTWCVLKMEELAREPQPRLNRLLAFAIGVGILTGIGALTRYAFGWAIIPVTIFLILFSGQRRLACALAALGAFAIILTPWVVRNFSVSGTAFGTAGFAVMEGTTVFPRFQLEQSMQPVFFNAHSLTPYLLKLSTNLRDIFQNELPKLGGSWASVLFLAGLLLAFRNIAARRMRYFLLMCLGMFVIVQSLGRTQLSEESPEVNSENLLILLAPLVFIYGASFFFTLLDQMQLPALQLRYVITGAFAVICCLPMIFTLLPPRTNPLAFPPYYPPEIQMVSSWMKPDELMMADAPWAVAWYGDHQCAWLTADARTDFFALNDNLKTVEGIYFTTETMDQKFLSEMARGGADSWGHFILDSGTQSVPPDFPLHAIKILNTGMFITDRQRWLAQ